MAAYSQLQNGGPGPNGAAPPPVRRMTYGSPQPQQEQAARAELFAGAGPAASAQQQLQQPASVDDMDNQQLMQHAVATHKDTTATTRRALQVGGGALCAPARPPPAAAACVRAWIGSSMRRRHRTRGALQIVEQTKEIQASTFVALKDQGDQMQRIEQDMDKVRARRLQRLLGWRLSSITACAAPFACARRSRAFGRWLCSG